MIICKHFKSCGGCSYQNLNYSEEVAIKKQKLENYLNFIDVEKKFYEARERFFYRNRMDFVVHKEEKNLLIGFREKGKWFKVINLEECLIFSKKTFEYLESIRSFLIKNKTEAYDLIKKQGNVRYAVIRESKNLKKTHINFVVTENFPAEKFLNEYNHLFTSVSVSVNNTLSDVSYGKLLSYHGEIYSEKIHDLEFIISPNSFFQTNTKMTELMLKEIEKFVEGKVLLDLYSGVGLFSLYFSNKFEKIIGVEVEESSVEDAKKSAVFNGIKNASFVKSKVEDVIRMLKGDFAIVDPPRAGLTAKVIKGLIINDNIKNLLYVSCNIKTFARDLKYLIKTFEVDEIMAFDFFPNTEHFEVVGLLSKKV